MAYIPLFPLSSTFRLLIPLFVRPSRALIGCRRCELWRWTELITHILCNASCISSDIGALLLCIVLSFSSYNPLFVQCVITHNESIPRLKNKTRACRWDKSPSNRSHACQRSRSASAGQICSTPARCYLSHFMLITCVHLIMRIFSNAHCATTKHPFWTG